MSHYTHVWHWWRISLAYNAFSCEDQLLLMPPNHLLYLFYFLATIGIFFCFWVGATIGCRDLKTPVPIHTCMSLTSWTSAWHCICYTVVNVSHNFLLTEFGSFPSMGKNYWIWFLFFSLGDFFHFPIFFSMSISLMQLSEIEHHYFLTHYYFVFLIRSCWLEYSDTFFFIFF